MRLPNDATLQAVRESIVDRFNTSADEAERQTIQTEADTLNGLINDNDLDIRTICFVCPCGAYANDRQNGRADCDNGCGNVHYEMIVL